MNPFLMYRDRNFDVEADVRPHTAELTQDLELNILFEAMASGDKLMFEIARKALLSSICSAETILYRQQIFSDCLRHGEIVRELYSIATEAVESEREVPGGLFALFSRSPLLHRSVQVLKVFLDILQKVRRIAEGHGPNFASEGFSTLFGMLTRELDDEYLGIFAAHLRELEFRDGILMSAELGKGNKGKNYNVHKPPPETENKAGQWFRRQIERLFLRDRSSYVYEVPTDDDSGIRALSELRGQGITSLAITLAQSADHILSFCRVLRSELGFYIGCLNLYDRLAAKGERVCFPEPLPSCNDVFRCRRLYDVCLSLKINDKAIGNDVIGEDKRLFIITGANRGGKSTFLRSVGIAQLMMQCGMFVPAESFSASVCGHVYTHFKREEDAGMKRGKLEEELARMSTIIEHVTRDSMILMNESFASTNEMEGSAIARQILCAIYESGIKVFYVTHMFSLAGELYAANVHGAMFLRAERLPDGRRTFRVIPGEPLETSYGEDLYRRIFQDDEHPKFTPARRRTLKH